MEELPPVTPIEEVSQEQPATPVVAQKQKWKPTRSQIIAITMVAILAIGLFSVKGLIIAATVNGSPITRLAVIQELEKQSGKVALESLIRKKLIHDELVKNNVSVNDDEVNAEIAKIEEQLTAQGTSLDDALAAQGMVRDQLVESISINLGMEKLLADKVQVTDEDVNEYIAQNEITPPEGKTREELVEEVREGLRQQKLQAEIEPWVTNLTNSASIKYYVEY